MIFCSKVKGILMFQILIQIIMRFLHSFMRHGVIIWYLVDISRIRLLIYNSQRLAQVPDKLVAGGDMPSVTSTPHVRLHPSTVDQSGVSSPETPDRETEDELIRLYQP